jgi:hypothetical protein
MSSTIPLPPREQLYKRYCSNKQTHYSDRNCPPPTVTRTAAAIGPAVINTHTIFSKSFLFPVFVSKISEKLEEGTGNVGLASGTSAITSGSDGAHPSDSDSGTY